MRHVACACASDYQARDVLPGILVLEAACPPNVIGCDPAPGQRRWSPVVMSMFGRDWVLVLSFSPIGISPPVFAGRFSATVADQSLPQKEL